MNYTLIFALICFIIVFIILIFILCKNNKELKETKNKLNFIKTIKKDEIKTYFNSEWKEQEYELKQKLKTKIDDLEKIWQLESQKHYQQLNTLDNEIKKFESILKEKEERYKEVNQDLDLYRKGKIKEIDNTAIEYEKRKRIAVDNSINEYRNQITIYANNYFTSLEKIKENKETELKNLTETLEEERSKRAAINEEIRRQRQVEEEQDFYRIQLDSEDKDDVEILRNVAPRLRHPEAINKVIWTGYYQKPLAELRKRLLPNGDISGVYKITRLKTGEIYIGQSTSIDKRYQEHTKTALGVGNLASSQLHRAMSKDGPEQFTWEILEEVPKDKLRERESYYIDFYDSKTYGLNSVTGDKNK